MLPHHQNAIDRLTARIRNEGCYDALFITGSVMKDLARPDSDIDFIVIATPEEYARRAPTDDFHYWTNEVCDYPGGYADGKVVELAFLEDVAERGSEVARAAFVGARIAFSRLDGMEDLLARILTYPEHEREDKMRGFSAQLQGWLWFAGEAQRRGDAYLMTRTVAELVLWAGRLILAHNRILYPYHKHLMHALREAPEKPEGLFEAIDALMAAPSYETADRLTGLVLRWQEWPRTLGSWASRFIRDREWNWRTNTPPLEDS